jgi:hypothetical protein
MQLQDIFTYILSYECLTSNQEHPVWRLLCTLVLLCVARNGNVLI